MDQTNGAWKSHSPENPTALWLWPFHGWKQRWAELPLHRGKNKTWTQSECYDHGVTGQKGDGYNCFLSSSFVIHAFPPPVLFFATGNVHQLGPDFADTFSDQCCSSGGFPSPWKQLTKHYWVCLPAKGLACPETLTRKGNLFGW